MDVARLHRILRETTVQLRKVEQVEAHDGAVHVFAMPSTDEVQQGEGDVWRKVDLHFIDIGVRQDRADLVREELMDLLDDWPSEAEGYPTQRLVDGPSYIGVGAVLGDQGAAFQLFALGEVLGLWKVITPETLGFEGEEADRLAGSGYVMVSGYKRTNALLELGPRD